MGVKLHTPTLLPLRKFFDLFAFHRHELLVVHQRIANEAFVNAAGNKGTDTTDQRTADATQNKTAQTDRQQLLPRTAFDGGQHLLQTGFSNPLNLKRQ